MNMGRPAPEPTNTALIAHLQTARRWTATRPMTMLVMTSTPWPASFSHLVGDDGLGQTELGDAVDQHAAGGVQGLKDGDLIALLGQVAGAGQAGTGRSRRRPP